MPEIDIDLFQVLTLAGLAILLILVLALTSTVSKLSKAVKALTPGAGAESSAPETEPAAEAAPAVVESDETSEGSGVAAAAALGATAAATGAVSSSEEEIAASVEPEPSPAASQWGEPAAEEAATSTWAASTMADQPVEAEPAAAEPAVASAEPAAAATPAAEELPEEQPFERGGRWWFKRGDELLIYEEQTGQWSAAPDGAFESASSATSEFGPTSQQAAATAVTTADEPVTTSAEPAQTSAAAVEETQTFGAISDETATAWRTDETPVGGTAETSAAPEPVEEVSSSDDTSMWGIGESTPAADESPAAENESATFWKCPSCGAVNGSTAASCRMCFAQRP